MTDNEIIKALECCASNSCDGCPIDELKLLGTGNCISIILTEALDYINRQKAEIERLNIELTAMRGAANSYRAEAERLEDEVNRLRDYCDDYGKFVDEPRIKFEAIKDFAHFVIDRSKNGVICTSDIPDLAKEITEKGKEEL